MEEQHGGSRQHSVARQAQIVQNGLPRLFQEGAVLPSIRNGLPLVKGKGRLGKLLDGDARHKLRIPRAALALKKHLLQRGACHLHRRASTAVVEMPPIADQSLAVRNINADIVALRRFHQIYVRNEPKLVADLRRQELEQLLLVLERKRLPIIIDADAKRPAIRVRKRAQPFEMLVIPLPLPFYMLVLFHN